MSDATGRAISKRARTWDGPWLRTASGTPQRRSRQDKATKATKSAMRRAIKSSEPRHSGQLSPRQAARRSVTRWRKRVFGRIHAASTLDWALVFVFICSLELQHAAE